jgi:CheY-like chemotaxis protein
MTNQDTSFSQRQFLSKISHEIRTPLNAISGMSQLLADTELNTTQKEFVQTIQQAGSHLLSLVDNILDVAKFQANEMVLSTDTVEACDEIKLAMSEMLGFAKEKRIAFSFQCTPEVGGTKLFDRRRFRQCLSNLLSNAIKFTDTGKVRVSAWVGTAEDLTEMLYVSVTDSGLGIDANHLKDVFRLFHQKDAGIKRNFDGSGLGLPVTRRLAQLMGGDVEAVSTPGVGSTFTLSLAFTPPAAEDLAEEEQFGRILVVEDNKTNQRLIGLVLEKLGHQYELASDGVEGLELFQASEFDLILMDLHMPRMDGFEATAEIRKSGLPAAGIPIIALTADVRPGIEDKISKAGMDAYLAKPFEVPVLATTIAQILAISRASNPEIASRAVRTQSN